MVSTWPAGCQTQLCLFGPSAHHHATGLSNCQATDMMGHQQVSQIYDMTVAKQSCMAIGVKQGCAAEFLKHPYRPTQPCLWRPVDRFTTPFLHECGTALDTQGLLMHVKLAVHLC